MSIKPLKNKNRFIIQSALIGALYVILTLLSGTLGLASGPIQLRLGEALTILPVFTPAAVPGLFFGCLLSNFLTGCAVWDIIVGSLATLIGAVGTALLKQNRHLRLLPPLISNTLILPFILTFVYHFEGSFIYFMITIFCGELLSCVVLGNMLFHLLDKHRDQIPWQ